MKKVTIFSIIFFFSIGNHAFAIDTLDYKKTSELYEKAFLEMQQLIMNHDPFSFKKAVFLEENTFLRNILDYNAFNTKIIEYTILMKAWMKANPLRDYHYSDSVNFLQNYAIYKIMKDSIAIVDPEGKKTYTTIPLVYDFVDFDGKKDWSRMFVSKLLYTYSGNCHNLPYLYKILADELNATCWLSLAPNHIYVKNRCKKIGWYNTELTSGEFPIDAWISASGYVPLNAIQNGIYMDTLSNQQAVALCVLDLAKGYEFQTKNYYDGLILKCCDLVLKYHPVNVQALLLKAETLKRIYEKQVAEKVDAKETYNNMEQLYVKLFDLGYREMPEKMYMEWLMSVNTQKSKYSNKQVKQTITANKK
jgi:hypothetical protein